MPKFQGFAKFKHWQNHHHVCLGLAALLLMTACAGIGPVKEEQAKNIQRVGVISFMDENFRIYDYGLSIFERRDRNRIEVSGWNLEEMVQHTVRTELQEKSEFTHVATNIKRADLSAAYGSNANDIWDKLDNKDAPNVKAIDDKLGDLAQQNNVDTWIIVFPLKNNSPVLFRELFVVGLGAVRELTGAGRKAALFSGIDVKVVTAANGDVIGSTFAFDWEMIDESLWEETQYVHVANRPYLAGG
jgi:hypothetical protein